ncbi:hypothetical protein DEU56DRAFT_902407 [Suillus clintonianus]|uniref:uncharacterized protein n=1 Tax=Suillus clintonianus TaxID=1904413 RepID=UPI001B870AB7|nr:uncharacterized protein DEU56DRAFT_902407 [Suillus clintonianus]KAG2131758.1 hypothetical protein DEU56DRAFT_902407 [Suillus clintonianus]
MALHYFPEAFTFNGTPGERSLRDREQVLPESLCYTSSITRVLCFVAIGRPDLEDHWESLQSDEAFEKASLLLTTSGIFVTTGSPVSYLEYNSPATYFLLFMSLMMAMIAMLTSGLNMIRWLQADRQWTREQLMPGGYFLLSYLLSIVMPILFVGLSLNCFIFAMLVAGFYSQNTYNRSSATARSGLAFIGLQVFWLSK